MISAKANLWKFDSNSRGTARLYWKLFLNMRIRDAMFCGQKGMCAVSRSSPDRLQIDEYVRKLEQANKKPTSSRKYTFTAFEFCFLIWKDFIHLQQVLIQPTSTFASSSAGTCVKQRYVYQTMSILATNVCWIIGGRFNLLVLGCCNSRFSSTLGLCKWLGLSREYSCTYAIIQVLFAAMIASLQDSVSAWLFLECSCTFEFVQIKLVCFNSRFLSTSNICERDWLSRQRSCTSAVVQVELVLHCCNSSCLLHTSYVTETWMDS